MIHVVMMRARHTSKSSHLIQIQVVVYRNRQAYIHGLEYTHMPFLLCQLRGSKRNDTPITISIPRT